MPRPDQGPGRAVGLALATMVANLVAVAGLSVLLREQLAAGLSLSETRAGAAVPAVAIGWLPLYMQRGLLAA